MSDPLKPAPDAPRREPSNPSEAEVDYWVKEIDLARKREKNWRGRAKEVTQIYEAEKASENSFNILYSNTETLLPAIYNTLPRPVVRRRYLDSDPLAKAASDVLRRSLEYFLDTPDDKYVPFDELFRFAAVGALVPGRGITRIRYDADDPDEESAPIAKDADPAEEGEEHEENDPPEEPQDAAEPAGTAPDEAGAMPAAPAKPVYEAICGEDVPYDRVLFGYARKYRNVPWIAYLHKMSKADIKKNFSATIAEQINFQSTSETMPGEGDDGKADSPESNTGSEKTVDVWEIWHKARKRVIWLCPVFDKRILRRDDDPYGLSGFFMQPTPLQFLVKQKTLTPTALYDLYREQARELNRITIRINKIVDALKVRGFYDSQLKGDLENLLEKDDNTLIPAQNVAAFGDGVNLDRLLYMMPIDKLVNVLNQLYVARDQTKNLIYEVTGISDILRGAGEASETATQSNIKSQWGTMKLRRMQLAVQIYIRAIIRIMSELMCKTFTLDTFKAITGLQFISLAEKQQAQMMIQPLTIKMQFMQQQMQGMGGPPGPQPPPQPGPPQAGPPGAPPPPNPQMQQMQQAMQGMQQQLQQAQQTSQQIAWEEVLAELKNDTVRRFKIDIETNSTVEADATEDQKNISELFNAVAQLVGQFGPMVGNGSLPVGALKGMLLVVARRFRFGPEVEDELMKMADQMPQQKQDPKAALELQVAQIEAASKQQELNQKMQIAQQQHQNKMAQIDMQSKIAQEKLQMQWEELQQKRAEAALKVETAQAIALTKPVASPSPQPVQ